MKYQKITLTSRDSTPAKVYNFKSVIDCANWLVANNYAQSVQKAKFTVYNVLTGGQVTCYGFSVSSSKYPEANVVYTSIEEKSDSPISYAFPRKYSKVSLIPTQRLAEKGETEHTFETVNDSAAWLVDKGYALNLQAAKLSIYTSLQNKIKTSYGFIPKGTLDEDFSSLYVRKPSMKPEQLFTMQAVAFKRHKNSPFEPGLMFNESYIIDQNGQIPDEVYNSRMLASIFSVDLQMVFKAISERVE